MDKITRVIMAAIINKLQISSQGLDIIRLNTNKSSAIINTLNEIRTRHVATCKPVKFRLTSFSETLNTFLHPVSFILKNEGTGQTKWSLGL